MSVAAATASTMLSVKHSGKNALTWAIVRVVVVVVVVVIVNPCRKLKKRNPIVTDKNNPCKRRVICHKPDVLNRHAVQLMCHTTNKKALGETLIAGNLKL